MVECFMCSVLLPDKRNRRRIQFRCSILCVAESFTSYFTPFVCWHLPKTHKLLVLSSQRMGCI